MDREALKRLLEDVQSGRLTIDAAGARLAALPYEDLGFAKLDVHRALRAGGPEAVFCPGKTGVRGFAGDAYGRICFTPDGSVPTMPNCTTLK